MVKKEAYQLAWVTENLAVGHAPMCHAHLDSLRNQGVTSIVNLCGEFCDLHEIEEQAGFEVYHIPLADEEAPELKQLEKALEWMDEAIYLGKKVLIHCRHGIGRTGTVLNAYLLRRGLGHKLAARHLKKLRSKPANFSQWRTVRNYGKQSGKLTIREPSLEFRHAVNLAPFFSDWERLAYLAEDAMDISGISERCGREHDRCSRTPILLSLAGAVHLSHSVNSRITGELRLSLIDRAVETAKMERQVASDTEGDDWCLSDAGAVCPLLRDGGCSVFEHRPLQCRLYGLDQDTATELWDTVFSPGLSKVSSEIYFALTGIMADRLLPKFALADVVSGRFVQTLFHYMREDFGV